MKPTKRQKPFKGGRLALPSCVLPKIRAVVEREARFFGVSKSFVIAVALADIFGISEQEHYAESKPKLRRVK